MITKNEKRICPHCKAEYEGQNVTICKKCGYVTIKKVITKGVANRETPMGQ